MKFKQHITAEEVNIIGYSKLNKIIHGNNQNPDFLLYRVCHKKNYKIKEIDRLENEMAEKITIGKMIEILEACGIHYTVDEGYWPVWVVTTNQGRFEDELLCDALFEAVKTYLGVVS